jgi:hypothetical protein
MQHKPSRHPAATLSFLPPAPEPPMYDYDTAKTIRTPQPI